MADARAGVRVVVAECRANHFLHEVGFFVRAARRGDAADRIAPVFRLDALELIGRVADGLFPAYFAPGIGVLGANHRFGDAILVRGVAPREAALHAGVAVVGLAVFVGHHADDFLVVQFRLERAAHAAVRAGRDDAAIR